MVPNSLFSHIQGGDTIKYPALAATLKRIAKNGRDEFYKGETAKISSFSKYQRR
jgi:gamma-glutamyltranspeptidase/glutathione hydrolase